MSIKNTIQAEILNKLESLSEQERLYEHKGSPSFRITTWTPKSFKINDEYWKKVLYEIGLSASGKRMVKDDKMLPMDISEHYIRVEFNVSKEYEIKDQLAVRKTTEWLIFDDMYGMNNRNRATWLSNCVTERITCYKGKFNIRRRDNTGEVKTIEEQSENSTYPFWYWNAESGKYQYHGFKFLNQVRQKCKIV